MAAGGRPNFRLNTPVGVFCFANAAKFRTSSLVQGSRRRALYLGCALRGPFLPIGEPGRFHAAFAMCLASKKEKSTTDRVGSRWQNPAASRIGLLQFCVFAFRVRNRPQEHPRCSLCSSIMARYFFHFSGTFPSRITRGTTFRIGKK